MKKTTNWTGLLVCIFIVGCLAGATNAEKQKMAAASVAPHYTGIYPESLPADGSFDMITRISLRRSLYLAGENLLANLKPKRNYLPNWDVKPAKDGTVKIDGACVVAHNLGRWWDAMLRLQDSIGFPIPHEVEVALQEELFHFFDNSDNLLLAPFDGKYADPCFELHSSREGLLALNALVRYRQSRRAAEKGHAMITSILRLTDEDGSWLLGKCEYAQLAREMGLENSKNTVTITSGGPVDQGRLIEALVWFYETTGDPIALRAADRFARLYLANVTRPDGSLGKQPGVHTHSYLGTLRGLLLYGELTEQHEYIDTIAATYRKTVCTLLKKSGFLSHDMNRDYLVQIRGEAASAGDAAQLALWLATRHSYTEFFDDVERIVRARLIPSQITETPPLKQRELEPLLIGAYGGMYTESHAGKISTTDITAAVTHSLIDIYRHIAVRSKAGLRVNFHFDYEDENVRVISQRDKSATVTILPRIKENVLVRIPRWTSHDSVVLKVDGKPIEVLMLGDYALVPKNILPGTIVLTYALPVSTEIERTNNVDYSITWRGDEIIAISPNSDFFPFYPNSTASEG